MAADAILPVELSADESPNGSGPHPVYSVAPPGQQPLPLDRTLGQCGVADGTVLTAETASYKGFFTNPLDWADALAKFSRLVTPFTGERLRDQLAGAIEDLDTQPVRRLTTLLARVPLTRRKGSIQQAGRRP